MSARCDTILVPILLLLAPAATAQATAYKFGAGAAWNDDYGWSVADAGDVDGDGVPDVVVGSPRDDLNGTDAGAARVYSGRTGALVRTWFGSAGDLFGWSVDGVGDVDGDGASDVIVGAPQWAGGDGLTQVLSGATGGPIYSYAGSPTSQNGTAVRGLGDVDGDGVGDFAHGAPRDDNINTDTGRLTVRSGASGLVLADYVITVPGALVGSSVDVIRATGDPTTSRILLGSPGDGNGRAYVVNANGTTYAVHAGAWANGWFGGAVAGLGDVTGDGFEDYAVSEAWADLNGTDSGRVVLYSGATFAVTQVWPGPEAFARYGETLAGLDDFDGDGLPDLLVGAPSRDVPTADAGFAAVVSPIGGTWLATWSGGVADELGRGLASAGDLNGDGVRDLLIGAPRAPFGSGEAYAILARLPEPVVYCTAKVNSQGCVPAIGWSGVPSLSVADDFRVSATNVLNKKNGLLFWGVAPAAAPFLGGTLCVQPPLQRTAVQYSAGSAVGDDCSGTFDFWFSQAYLASTLPGFGLGAGDTLHAQYWSRDPGYGAPNDTGLTDAVSFLVAP